MPGIHWPLASAIGMIAALVAPASSRDLPGGLAVADEADQQSDLRDLLLGEPALLLPVFTRCTGTCPMTAVRLKEALAKARAPFRVAVLSFDPDDRATDLKEFRQRFDLPARWHLLRATDAAATRDFLGSLGFRFMRSGGGYNHPDETFVFSPAGAWSATFTGSAFSTDDLEAAGRRGFLLIRPEAWIALACVGLAISGIAIAIFARRARYSPASPGSSRS